LRGVPSHGSRLVLPLSLPLSFFGSSAVGFRSLSAADFSAFYALSTRFFPDLKEYGPAAGSCLFPLLRMPDEIFLVNYWLLVVTPPGDGFYSLLSVSSVKFPLCFSGHYLLQSSRFFFSFIRILLVMPFTRYRPLTFPAERLFEFSLTLWRFTSLDPPPFRPSSSPRVVRE